MTPKYIKALIKAFQILAMILACMQGGLNLNQSYSQLRLAKFLFKSVKLLHNRGAKNDC